MTIQEFLDQREEELRTAKLYPYPDKTKDWRSGYERALVDVMSFLGMLETLESRDAMDEEKGFSDPFCP